ncbi:MAG: glycine oxidase ThiO [Actinomycetota bacterium]|nr:glycine oxidase ThiO [Actinomycetota bacterium]
MAPVTSRPDAPDVVVVGAGVIGLSSAWRLAQAGASVTVVDERPARGASWAAAGMLAPVSEAHYGEEALLQLNLASHARWPGFAAELAEVSGRDPGYRRSGTLVIARDADDRAVLDDLHDFHRRLGLSVTRLRSRACRHLEPALAPTVRAGLHAPDDDQVDNRALLDALLAACERAEVQLVTARAAAIERDRDRVTGVRLAGHDTIPAPTVVLAAGAWSAGIAGVPPLPVRPVKGQLLHLREVRTSALHAVAPPLLHHNVRAVGGRPDRPAVYLVPRGDGRVVVGATVEERGEDVTVTAGAVLDLLREAYELVPGITELELTETVAGLRPGSPDNAPLIGAGGLDGLIVATGHFRNGILLAPITADAVTALVVDRALPQVVAAFTPARFAGTADGVEEAG